MGGDTWTKVGLAEVIEFDPPRHLERGETAKKVAMENVSENQRWISDFQLTSFPGSGARFKNGDTLLARITPSLENGKTAYVDFLDEGEIAFGSTEFIVLSPKNNAVDHMYLYYIARSPDFREFAIKQMTGTSGRQRVPSVSLHKYKISLPPFPVQRRIAGILGTLDDKIELNRCMNRTLEAIGQAVFREWFVESEDVEVWEIGKLGDFIGVNERSISEGYSKEEIEYIDISSVSVGRLEGTSRYALKYAPSRAKRLVQQGDTIWSTVRPNRKSYLFIDNPKKNLVVSTGFAVLTPKKIPPSFLYYMTTTEQFVDYLVSNADGSAYPAVLPDRFADAEFPVPPENMLDKFENVAGPVLAQIAHNENESRVLANLRDALMPKLLRGEISVKV